MVVSCTHVMMTNDPKAVDNIPISRFASIMQSCHSFIISSIQVNGMLDVSIVMQNLKDFVVAKEARQHKSSLSTIISCIQIKPFVAKLLNKVQIGISDSLKK